MSLFHTIVVEIPDHVDPATFEASLTQAIEESEHYFPTDDYNYVNPRVAEYHRERMTEEAPAPAPQWCPICKRNHDNVGEATDAGLITRACSLIPTSDPRYYGSPVYTGDRRD